MQKITAMTKDVTVPFRMPEIMIGCIPAKYLQQLPDLLEPLKVLTQLGVQS